MNNYDEILTKEEILKVKKHKIDIPEKYQMLGIKIDYLRHRGIIKEFIGISSLTALATLLLSAFFPGIGPVISSMSFGNLFSIILGIGLAGGTVSTSIMKLTDNKQIKKLLKENNFNNLDEFYNYNEIIEKIEQFNEQSIELKKIDSLNKTNLEQLKEESLTDNKKVLIEKNESTTTEKKELTPKEELLMLRTEVEKLRKIVEDNNLLEATNNSKDENANTSIKL